MPETIAQSQVVDARGQIYREEKSRTGRRVRIDFFNTAGSSETVTVYQVMRSGAGRAMRQGTIEQNESIVSTWVLGPGDSIEAVTTNASAVDFTVTDADPNSPVWAIYKADGLLKTPAITLTDSDAIHDNVSAEISAVTEKATPVAEDLLLLEDSADSNSKKRVRAGNLPFLADVVDDTTPQLGGMLDVNGNAIGDGTRELITFVEDGSAVNHIEIENEAAGNAPVVRAAGDDTDINLYLEGKGNGGVVLNDEAAINGSLSITGTVDGRDVATDGAALDDLNAGFALKTSDETKNSDTTTAADSALVLALGASSSYYVEFNVFFTSHSTPRFKCNFSDDSGGSWTWLLRRESDRLSDGVLDESDGDFTVTTSTGTTYYIRYSGVVTTDGDAGNLSFDWAQAVSSAEDTTVLAKSTASARKIA